MFEFFLIEDRMAGEETKLRWVLEDRRMAHSNLKKQSDDCDNA